MIKSLTSLVRKLLPKETVTVPVDLTPTEKEIIRFFAAGDIAFRMAAIEIYRNNLTTVGPRGCLHMQFMSEFETSAPDPALRAALRSRVLAQ